MNLQYPNPLLSKNIATMEQLLFPWISPTFKSIAEMEQPFSGNGTIICYTSWYFSLGIILFERDFSNLIVLGIVMCVNDKYAPVAMATVQMIRDVYGSTIPVEIFFMGNEDLSIENQNLLQSILHVKTKNINAIFDSEILNIWVCLIIQIKKLTFF